MASTNFQGDVLLYAANDGGEISVIDGLISDCETFDTSVYLSLFGGNSRDSAGRAKETWWGNLIPGTKDEEKYVSKFQAIISGLPISALNIQKATLAAGEDLAWVKSNKIADEINIAIYAEDIKKLRVAIEFKKESATLFDCEYAFQWRNGNGLQQ